MNKENLTLEHLAKHLPFGLKCVNLDGNNSPNIYELNIYSTRDIEELLDIGSCQKMIFRPLSDLTKEITHKGERFVPLVRLASTLGFAYGGELHSIELGLLSDKIRIEILPYEIIMKLIEWHFDVDNLIEKGLAIDINTLETNPYD